MTTPIRVDQLIKGLRSPSTSFPHSQRLESKTFAYGKRVPYHLNQLTLVASIIRLVICILVYFYWYCRRAVVEELAKAGASVYTCSRNEAELDELCQNEWKANGFRVTGSVCDASSRAEREGLMREVSSSFGGKLDILVSAPRYSAMIDERVEFPSYLQEIELIWDSFIITLVVSIPTLNNWTRVGIFLPVSGGTENYKMSIFFPCSGC